MARSVALRDERKRNGLCPTCGGTRDSALVLCLPCREIAHQRMAKFRSKPDSKRKHVDYMREYYRRNPQRYRARWIKWRYGITQADYDRMLAAQGGVCAICECATNYSLSGKPRPLFIDHNHATGQVRGLLCNQCNLAIGAIDDDISHARRMIKYLAFWQRSIKAK